jgi:hypothetical protein
MSDRKTTLKMIMYSPKFENIEQAIKDAEKILRITHKESKSISECVYRIRVSISKNEAYLGEFVPQEKRTKGRPKRIYEPYEVIRAKGLEFLIEKELHLHILVEANPGAELAIRVCRALNKGFEKPIAKAKNCNNSFVEYVDAQECKYRSDDNINKIL